LDAVIEEAEEDEGIDSYWFFVNKWFARSEDDGEIIREFIPTDEHGKPLKGTPQGKKINLGTKISLSG
jgi:hypothetical protein